MHRYVCITFVKECALFLPCFFSDVLLFSTAFAILPAVAFEAIQPQTPTKAAAYQRQTKSPKTNTQGKMNYYRNIILIFMCYLDS